MLFSSKKLLTCLFICTVLKVASAQYRIDQWTADDGLPQNSVYSIKQTRDGYLWLATADGLVRFDGVRFTVFNKSNSEGIVNNRFTGLFETGNGDLWAGTEYSILTRYRHGRFTSYGVESWINQSGANISESDDGNPLFLLNDTQVFRFAEERFSRIADGESFQQISDVNETENISAACVFLSDKRQVACLWRGKLIILPQADGVSNWEFFSTIQDVDGTIWMLTREWKVVQFKDDKTAKVYTKQVGLPETPILLIRGARIAAISKDSRGGLWLTDLKTMRKELLTAQPPAALNNIHFGYEDREGNLWLGTMRDGLFRVRKQVITAYSKADGLLENNVYPIYEDRSGIVWIGTTKGVFRHQNGAFTLVKATENLNIDGLGEDSAGRLLISAEHKLYALDGDNLIQIYHSRLGVNWAVHTDREGALWIGSTNGLARVKDNDTQIFTTAEGLAGNNVKVIVDDKNGGLWIGAYGGLSHYKDGKLTSWTESSGLPTPTIRALYLDDENALWIGSYDSGLARFKDGTFTHYSTKNGLFNDGAFQILEDERRRFWISSNRGIYRVSRDELNEVAEGRRVSVSSVAYGKSDGMLNVESNGGRSPGGIRARDGRLWFPTQDGVAVINPETIRINTQPPPVIIEDVKIDNQSIPVEIIKNAIDDQQSAISINPRQQNFEIQYTALSFINSENLRFKYRLEGLDEEWVEAGMRRTAYFSYVPPGNYTFRVIAANSDGVWNEKGAMLKIVVIPAFYQTWWFRVLSVFAVMLAIFIIYRRRLSEIRRRQFAQEEFSRRLINAHETERRRVAAELHDSIGQSLAMIKNSAVFGGQTVGSVDEAKEHLAEISTASAQAISEVREIAYNLRPFMLDRLGLTKAISSLLNKIADNSQFKIVSEIENIDGLFESEEEISIYRIIQECLNNVLKHSEASEVKVKISKSERGVAIKISDDGRGFDAKNQSETRGGFGLIGMTERVRILGGTIEINSEAGKGTSVDIEIWKHK